MIKRILSRITGLLGTTSPYTAIEVYNDILKCDVYTFEKVISTLFNFSEEERTYIKNRLRK